MTTRPFECAPDYHGGMTEQEWTLVYQTEQGCASGLVDSLGAIIDYAKHHDMSPRLIDILQGMQDRAAWVACYAPRRRSRSSSTN